MQKYNQKTVICKTLCANGDVSIMRKQAHVIYRFFLVCKFKIETFQNFFLNIVHIFAQDIYRWYTLARRFKRVMNVF